MKKLLIMSLMMTLYISGIMAQDVNDGMKKDTTFVVNKPSKVTITDQVNAMKIIVEGSEDNPDFFYSKSIQSAPDSTVITEEKFSEWNFNVPFVNKKKKKYGNSVIMGGGGFGLGLVNALNAPSPMNVNMGASWEIMMNYWLGYEFHPWKTAPSLRVGIGSTWRNYRMNGTTRFYKVDNKIGFGDYEKGADIGFSRIKVFSWTLPIAWNQPLGSNFEFSFGPIVNFNTHASLKTCYKLDGKKVKETNNSIHQNPVTVDFMVNLQWNFIGLYFKYSPTNVLNTDFGPKFNTLSSGITLFY